jgi:hypothetical protein
MPKQQFRLQKGGQRKQTLADFKRYLNLSSGGDALELISAYMSTREGIKKRKEGNQNCINPHLSILVESLKKQHELAAPQEKRRWLSLVANLLPMDELQKLGWKINSHSFCNARKHCNQFGPGAPIPKPKLPPSKRPVLDLPQLVYDFFYKDEITRVGSKTIKKKMVSINFFC